MPKTHRALEGVPYIGHESEWESERQLEALLTDLPVEIAVVGYSASFGKEMDLDELCVVSRQLGRGIYGDIQLRDQLDHGLRSRLCDYLRRGAQIATKQEDLNGELKAMIGCALARVGEPEDIYTLRQLIEADLDRVRTARTAAARGDRHKLQKGGAQSWSGWFARAVTELDSDRADVTLLELLNNAEYEGDVAWALVRLAGSQIQQRPNGRIDYCAIWEARVGRHLAGFDDARGKRYANAIKNALKVILAERASAKDTRQFDYRLKILATALAAIDSQDSADLVLNVISLPGEWDGWQRIAAIENLLFNGVLLPADRIVTLLDPVFERSRPYGMHQQDASMVIRFLCLLPFVKDPAKGVIKIRQVLSEKWFPHYDLRNVVIALGHSRCDEALNLLRELPSDDARAKQLGDAWINAVATIGTTESRQLLLSLVDADIPGLPNPVDFGRDDVLTARIVELA